MSVALLEDKVADTFCGISVGQNLAAWFSLTRVWWKVRVKLASLRSDAD